ncbi:hypothetical protein CLV24_111132 [Pontibacter ummariensis]|uniref:Uncharacterized protein n=1 Tax=Pontibacter ummariensis TaxID=1610492 RepID=A0A239GNU4_9BACT|nr:hypothetical protein CLV24_111132 [Pontibacter ummariensis]SNS70163.1 hypothetical protein SAMN06296052_111132 [Pontibacter ummariensis]
MVRATDECLEGERIQMHIDFLDLAFTGLAKTRNR